METCFCLQYLSLCDGKTKKPMMLIAAAPEALVVVKKVELLGQNKCTWGPAFWCDTLENAKRCNVSQRSLHYMLEDIRTRVIDFSQYRIGWVVYGQYFSLM